MNVQKSRRCKRKRFFCSPFVVLNSTNDTRIYRILNEIACFTYFICVILCICGAPTLIFFRLLSCSVGSRSFIFTLIPTSQKKKHLMSMFSFLWWFFSLPFQMRTVLWLRQSELKCSQSGLALLDDRISCRKRTMLISSRSFFLIKRITATFSSVIRHLAAYLVAQKRWNDWRWSTASSQNDSQQYRLTTSSFGRLKLK